jgi:hypothetical protein
MDKTFLPRPRIEPRYSIPYLVTIQRPSLVKFMLFCCESCSPHKDKIVFGLFNDIHIVTYWVCHATNKFTLSGCSGYLLCYLYTLIHFTVVHFTIQYLDCFSTIYVGESIQLSLMAARLRVLSPAVNARLLSLEVNARLLSSEVNARLLSSEVNARLTWLMCSFSYICGRCYSMNLLL